MADLRYAVYVDDPETHESVVFVPGDEVPEWAVKLITNPNCWVDGKLPGDDKSDEEPKRRSTRK